MADQPTNEKVLSLSPQKTLQPFILFHEFQYWPDHLNSLPRSLSASGGSGWVSAQHSMLREEGEGARFLKPRFEVIWHHLHQGSAKRAESLWTLWDEAFTVGIRPHAIMGGAEEVMVWGKSWRTREGATVQSLGEVKRIQHQSGTTQGELVESSVQSQCLRVASSSVGLQPST